MRILDHPVGSAVIGVVALLVMASAGATFAGELYSMATEEGLELFLLDNRIQTTTLDLHRGAALSLTIAQNGVLTLTKRDSLAEHLGLTGSARQTVTVQSLTYEGFRVSPLGRVLNVEGRFQPSLAPSTDKTADSEQSGERHFDLDKRVSVRAAWDSGQGLRVFSF